MRALGTASAFLLFYFVAEGLSASVNVKDLLIIVSSQNRQSQTHLARQEAFKKSVISQLGDKSHDLQILFSGEEFRFPGHWLFLPVMELFLDRIKQKKWTIICQEETRFDIAKLLANLSKEDYTKPLFLGHALKDEEITIVHHFHEPGNFRYPDLYAGAIFSRPLVERVLAEKLSNQFDFRIDIQHELAMYLQKKVVDHNNTGISLQNRDYLCNQVESAKTSSCASWITNFSKNPKCDNFDRVRLDDVVFVVKTCQKNFKDRIPIIKRTWAKHVKHIYYFAEVANPDIPTINVGVPNTEHGHCGKFVSILRYVYSKKELLNKKWLMIADDDTLISIPRLLNLLRCYNQKSGMFVVGERYGYGSLTGQGADYPTGGAGIAMSMRALNFLHEEDKTLLHCNSNDEPDDMMLGNWIMHVNVPFIHSPLMHQARPADYTPDYLSHQNPVTFHKFWEADPDKIYNEKLNDGAAAHQEL